MIVLLALIFGCEEQTVVTLEETGVSEPGSE